MNEQMEGFDIEDFSIEKSTGFLSPKPPLSRLPTYYDPWEDLVSKLPALNQDRKTREAALELPLLEVNDQLLNSEEAWKRAYVVLTFLGQSYIWVEGEAALPPCVPKCIAVPWWKVAERLGIPPVMTYAATTLYNWYLLDPIKGIAQDNIGSLVTCTGSRDEEWFYIVALFVELAAAPMLPAMQNVYACMKTGDCKKITAELKTITSCIEDMICALNLMYKNYSPDFFYQKIRPYQAGSMGLDAFPEGIIYEGVDTKPKMFSGASAAQSTTVPALDTFLGVTHEGETSEFLKLQKKHMPRPHRKFLEILEKQPSVKEYVARCDSQEVLNAYNMAVQSLTKFRSQHIVLVTQYIIVPKNHLSQQLNKSLETKGTGGSDFMVFLKTSRRETSDCVMKSDGENSVNGVH